MKRIRLLPMLMAGYIVAGCYSYSSVATPSIGADIRVSLTDEEALRISRHTGALTRQVDGRLLESTGDSIVVSILTYRASSETLGPRELRQSVVISRTGLETLEERELSMWRSGVVGVLVGSGIALAINRVVVGGSNDDQTDNGEPIGTFVPVFRIPIGR